MTDHSWEWKLRGGPPVPSKHYDDVLFTGDAVPGGALEFIEWLKDLIALVPTEFQDKVYIELGTAIGYEGDYYTSVRVGYMRPETDVEFARRQGEYEAALRAKEEFERAELVRLKQQYPDG
jgi:hypothetical protein